MKRIFWLAGVILLGVAPSLAAATKDCVPDSGCPKGMGPPKCCKPPPCEFLDALQKARAMQDLYGKEFASRVKSESSADDDLAPLVSEGDDDLAPLKNVSLDANGYTAFKEAVAQAMKEAREKFPRCPKSKRKIPDPPIFSVMPQEDCVLKTYSKGSFREMGFDEVLNESTSCVEVVTAKYESAKRRESGTCPVEVMDSTNYVAQALAWGEELDAEYASLLGDLQNYWSRCSIKPGSKLAREVAARGIRELKFNPPKGPKKKGPPKKSGN